MATTSYTYVLGKPHDNQLPRPTYNQDGVPRTNAILDGDGNIVTPEVPAIPPTINTHSLPCDGTVFVDDTDAVCYADITYVIDGVTYEQNIMNVPYLDATRLPLYLQYFVNNQAIQLGAQ